MQLLPSLLKAAPCWTVYSFLFAIAALVYESSVKTPGKVGLILAAIAVFFLIPLLLLLILFGMFAVAIVLGIFFVGGMVDLATIKLAAR